jgi:large subunit ribosomal protein L31
MGPGLVKAAAKGYRDRSRVKVPAFGAFRFLRIGASRVRRRRFGTRPMKPDIHPQYHMIKVVMTDGMEFFTRSTYGSEGQVLHLDIDPKTHPAWTGGAQQLLDRGGRLSRFNSRFGNMNFGKKQG